MPSLSPSAFFSLSSWAALSIATACSAPEPRPLELDELATGVSVRGASPAVVAEALELVDLRALPFERPVVATPPDYDRAAFWHASALAWNGELRSARRTFAVATGLSRSSGAPEAAMLEVEQTGFDGDDRDTWVALTFDVLGLLGMGRSDAARELASAEARAAWADVESAAWRARFDVDRARSRLGAVLAKIDRLNELLESSRPSLTRAELLFEKGRVSEGEIARLRGVAAEAAHELHKQNIELLQARRALADAAGLPPNAPALASPTSASLEEMLQSARIDGLPSARELLDRNPALRRARLEYAVAEAALRDEVARTRPGMRLGPAVDIAPDDTLPGGVLVVDLPLASALSGRVEAARETRERAREALEESLRDALTRRHTARAQFETARAALDGHAVVRDAETSTVWRAARARFDVDSAAIEPVGMALRDRAMSISDRLDVELEIALAWLDVEETNGPGTEEPR